MNTMIETESDIERLVAHLHDDARTRPVCLVSTRNGSETPLIDVEALTAAVGDIADVHVVRTGALTWRLSELMDEGTHVFGGAGRVYPLGTDWRAQPRLSPLRFVWVEADAPRALENLISDAERFAKGDGGTSARSSSTGPAQPLGAFNSDVLDQLREARRVAASNPNAGTSRQRPTPHAVAAAVSKPSSAPSAPTAPGPVPTAQEPTAPRPAPAGLSGLALVASASSAPSVASAPEPPEQPAPARGRALNDALMALEAARAEIRQLVAGQDAADARARRAVASEMRDLIAEIGRAQRAAETAKQDAAAKVAAARARYSRTDSDDTAATPMSAYRPELFEDADDALRHAILLTWVERVSAPEKATLPLPEYVIGADFADSFAAFDTAKQSKALRAIVDVLIDRAKDMPSRAVHALRLNDGGDSGVRVRETDGAVGYRAYIESNVASARRLHFWKLPEGSIELARVVLHDDVAI